MLVKPQWLEVYQHRFHTVLVTFLLLKSKTLSMAQCPPEVRKAVKAMRVVLYILLLIFLDVSSPARLYHENIRNVRSMSMYMWHSGTWLYVLYHTYMCLSEYVHWYPHMIDIYGVYMLLETYYIVSLHFISFYCACVPACINMRMAV